MEPKYQNFYIPESSDITFVVLGKPGCRENCLARSKTEVFYYIKS